MKTTACKQCKDVCNNSGEYRPKHLGCNHIYIVPIRSSYNDSVHNIKHNNETKYAKHVVDHNHECGIIGDTVEILEVVQKGSVMDSYEKLYVYVSLTSYHKKYQTQVYKTIFNIDE
jgi:hypothetical protein